MDPHSGLTRISEQTGGLPGGQHQRLPPRPRPRGQRHPELLHAELRAEQRRVRRQVPRDCHPREASRARSCSTARATSPCARRPASRCSRTRRRCLRRSNARPFPTRSRSVCPPLRFPEAGRPGLTPIARGSPDGGSHVPALDRGPEDLSIRFHRARAHPECSRRARRENEPALRAAGADRSDRPGTGRRGDLLPAGRTAARRVLARSDRLRRALEKGVGPHRQPSKARRPMRIACG